MKIYALPIGAKTTAGLVAIDGLSGVGGNSIIQYLIRLVKHFRRESFEGTHRQILIIPDTATLDRLRAIETELFQTTEIPQNEYPQCIMRMLGDMLERCIKERHPEIQSVQTIAVSSMPDDHTTHTGWLLTFFPVFSTQRLQAVSPMFKHIPEHCE